MAWNNQNNNNRYPQKYNNNNNNTGGGFQVTRGYQNYGSNGQGCNTYNNNAPQGNGPKRSWAVYNVLKDTEGVYIVNAFRLSNRFGLIRYTVKPYHATWENQDKGIPDVVESKAGLKYHKMLCVIEYEAGAPELVPALLSLSTKKITLQNKGLVITPNGHGQLRSGKQVKGAVVKFA